MTHAIMLIFAVAIVAMLFNRAKCRRDALRDGGSAAEASALRDEIRTLKQRIVTLERIATDGSTALDREIEALRDRP